MLFRKGKFKGASGRVLPFRIEGDDLNEEAWQVIADALLPTLAPFRRAVGVPRGGRYLALLLNQHRNLTSKNLLIVDDVWTTGGSMRQFAQQYMDKHSGFDPRWHGVVAFSRGQRPIYVSAFMQLMV